MSKRCIRCGKAIEIGDGFWWMIYGADVETDAGRVEFAEPGTVETLAMCPECVDVIWKAGMTKDD